MKKLLMFDFRESEQSFCQNNELIKKFDITYFPTELNEETVETLTLKQLTETEVLSVFITSNVTANVLDKFKNLKVIAARSTGLDHIDSAACSARGIKVLNVSDYGRGAVAQFTFTLLLALVRNLVRAVEDIKKFNVNPSNYIGYDLQELTLGVVGTGAIGAEICKIAQAFGMKILAFDPYPKTGLGVEYVSFDNLIRNADVITLHAPLTKENHHLLSAEVFAKMKPGAFLVNTSRGELVDTIALYNALTSGSLKAAALDVVECEDLNFYKKDFMQTLKTLSTNRLQRSLVVQKLIELPNVMITPHIAYDTNAAVNVILQKSFEDLDKLFS